MKNVWGHFRTHAPTRRALYALSCAALVSLFAELIASGAPLIVHFSGKWYFPIVRSYPASLFGDSDSLLPDYCLLREGPSFRNANNWMIFPLIPYGPDDSFSDPAGPPPGAPSRHHWLGTDDRGRDVFVRLLYGLRHSLGFALLCWSISAFVGHSLGLVQGYCGGIVDLIGQRLAEIWSAVPCLHVLLLLLCLLRPSLGLLAAVWIAFQWMPIYGYARGEALRMRQAPFVDAARAAGVRRCRIIFGHVLPHTLTPLLTLSPFLIGAHITGLAALDYLGLGLPPPMASWGELLQQGRENPQCWWLVIFPVLSLITVLLLLHLIGDGLRRALEGEKS